MSKIILPPLPEPTAFVRGDVYEEEQLIAYGQECARAALDAAALVCLDAVSNDPFCDNSAGNALLDIRDAIRALEIKP